MKITLLDVGSVEKEKEYYIVPIVYQDDKGQKREKKLYSFDQVPYKALKGAQAGQVFNIKLVKKGNFWNWAEVTPVEEGAASESSGGFQQARKSTYETPEERAVKNTRITRMSCLAQAVAVSAKEPGVLLADVLKIAEEFEGWVNRE